MRAPEPGPHWPCMQAFGLVVSGPANHYWQQLVQRTFGPKSDPNTVTFKAG